MDTLHLHSDVEILYGYLDFLSEEIEHHKSHICILHLHAQISCVCAVQSVWYISCNKPYTDISGIHVLNEHVQ